MDLISTNYGYTVLVEQRQKLDELAVSYYPGIPFLDCCVYMSPAMSIQAAAPL